MATIVTDDFNSYTDGDLNGQGSWSGDADFDVQGTVVKEGAKAVQIAVSDSLDNVITKIGSDIADGAIVAYGRVNKTNYGQSAFFTYDGAVLGTGLYFAGDNNIKYLKTGGWFNYQTYSIDTWYALQAEWRSSDKYVRYRVDSGAWTDWYAPYAAWTSLDRAQFNINNGVAGGIAYWDYIAETEYVELQNYTQSASENPTINEVNVRANAHFNKSFHER